MLGVDPHDKLQKNKNKMKISRMAEDMMKSISDIMFGLYLNILEEQKQDQ